EAQPAQKHEFKVAKGDSVMIKRECVKYLTGERPSTWVWDKVHTVYQLGTKRFPEGVLLWNIRSWICEECLINVNGRATEAAAQAAEEQKADREAFEQGMDPAAKAAEERAAAERAAIAREDSILRAKEAERIAQEQAEEAAAAERAKEDSIASQQKFKHSYDRFTIGLRGGAASLMHHAQKANWTCGGDVVLDLQYAHYWAKDGRPTDLGLIVGLGIGYAQSGLKVDRDSTAFTTGGVDYTVIAKDVKETDHELQLEVPVMFSLIHDCGLFFNIGPKFMIPVYSPYKQSVDQNNTHISAYFPTEGITVIDETVTGKYTGQQPTTSNGIQFNINVMLTAEIGYEWILKSGNSFGLGAYANYSVFNTFKNTTSATGLFDLTAPTETTIANLDVLSATKTYADKLGYFDAGIKLAYHFNFPKKKQFKDSKLF
ncbi:MAG: hypothetical protein IKQ50_04285, partial [Paludibacteraceae bacterium]|nr:hypothetical protein [Paludibacteraceae bacterium]